MDALYIRIGLRGDGLGDAFLAHRFPRQQDMLDVGHIVCGLRGVIKLQDPLYFLGNLLVEIVCHAFLVIGRFLRGVDDLFRFFCCYLIGALDELVELFCADGGFLFV